MNKEIFVLGIDPGLASMGWGVLRMSTLTNAQKTTTAVLQVQNQYAIEHMAHGVIETSSQEGMGHRLLHIEQFIDSLLARYPVNVLAYEKQFFVKNVTNGLQVAHALGVILLYAAKHAMLVESYTPKEIKLQITGTASAKKESVKKFICMQLGLDEVKLHHSADAMGAALCYAYRAKPTIGNR